MIDILISFFTDPKLVNILKTALSTFLFVFGTFLIFISLYMIINRKKIIDATVEAKRVLNEEDSGLNIVYGVMVKHKGKRGLKQTKRLSKHYLDNL